MKQNYRYKFIHSDPCREHKIEAKLNCYGEEGFRLHSVLPISSDGTSSYHIWVLEAAEPAKYLDHLADLEDEASREAAIEAEMECDEDDVSF